MASKLEILSQVMLSYKDDQNQVMNDINSLLNSREVEVDVINKIKRKISQLSAIYGDMKETENFIIQVSDMNKPDKEKEQDDSAT